MEQEKPKKYTTKIVATFIDTWCLEGYSRTADKLFTNEKTALPPLIYRIFNFEYKNIKYEFRWRDTTNQNTFSTTKTYPIFINPTELTTCWFDNQALNVHLWEADEEEEY